MHYYFSAILKQNSIQPNANDIKRENAPTFAEMRRIQEQMLQEEPKLHKAVDVDWREIEMSREAKRKPKVVIPICCEPQKVMANEFVKDECQKTPYSQSVIAYSIQANLKPRKSSQNSTPPLLEHQSTKNMDDLVPPDFIARATVQWKPDTYSDRCMRCSELFTMLYRRHHCRGCGDLLCHGCAPYCFQMVKIHGLEIPTITRMCLQCSH
ncbi:hypothetical protein EDD86DRAFT_206574 [Gorgonomyces haynaldii]|nr:hypothetical protein EDD86DRAFT_206574 [Gorgonomyces haynaldii]